MPRFILILLTFCCLPVFTAAQIFGPVAVPVDQTEVRNKPKKWLALDVSTGLNLVTRRKPLGRFPEADNLRTAPGARLGLQAIIFPDDNSRLVLGVDFIHDRGTLEGYTYSKTTLAFDPSGDSRELNKLTGNVRINERWLRWSLGADFSIGPVDLLVGFQVARIQKGSQRYEYEQTTLALFEGVTGQVIPLDQPVTRPGSTEFYGRNAYGGYSGMVLALSWPVTGRMLLRAEYEQGLHMDWDTASVEEWRQRRSRVGLTVGYRLFSR